MELKCNAPPRIYWKFPTIRDVKIVTEDDLLHTEITDVDVEYIRADIHFALQERMEALESAWLVDETIQADGSLRPSVLATIARYEKELSDLRTSIDEAVKEMRVEHKDTFDFDVAEGIAIAIDIIQSKGLTR